MKKNNFWIKSFWNDFLVHSLWILVPCILYFFDIQLGGYNLNESIKIAFPILFAIFLIVTLTNYVIKSNKSAKSKRIELTKEIIKTFNSVEDGKITWNYSIHFTDNELSFEIKNLIPTCNFHMREYMWIESKRHYICNDCPDYDNKKMEYEKNALGNRILGEITQRINIIIAPIDKTDAASKVYKIEGFLHVK